MVWNHKTDILSSNSKLYIVGEWREEHGLTFEREHVYTGTLAACLTMAEEDDKRNNTY